jgi:FkbM family methyltransferase
MQAQLERVRLTVEKLRLASDVRSASRMVRLAGASPRRSDAAAHSAMAPVAVNLRPLKGKRVMLRPYTTDYDVMLETFMGQFHVEPVKARPRTIFDLGANIGLTMAHYAVLYPEAQILGVELDAGNFAMCQQNTAPYRDRCTALCGAVWKEDGEVSYGRRQGFEWGFAVGSAQEDEQVTAPAFSMDSLFERCGWSTVDFVKMDIEGAERDVLRDAERWAPKVASIGVEVHAPYTVEECEHDLQQLGFKTARLSSHGAGVFGERADHNSPGPHT